MRKLGFSIVTIASIVVMQSALACKFDIKNQANGPFRIYGVMAGYPLNKWVVWHSVGWEVGVGETRTINVGPRFDDAFCANSLRIAYDLERNADLKSWFVDAWIPTYRPSLPAIVTVDSMEFIGRQRSDQSIECIEQAFVCD